MRLGHIHDGMIFLKGIFLKDMQTGASHKAAGWEGLWEGAAEIWDKKGGWSKAVMC